MEIIITIKGKYSDKFIENIIKDLQFVLTCRSKKGIDIELGVDNSVDNTFEYGKIIKEI